MQERVEVFFFNRSKKNIAVKQVSKLIRFLELTGIGDGIAMKFVVDKDRLNHVVRHVRQVLARCPGQVCDQGSSIGYRLGQERLDPRNRHSSKYYEAMKFNLRLWDRIYEMQFVPVVTWINEQCSHTEVNHGIYKVTKLIDLVYPMLFPEPLVLVPWHQTTLRRQCEAHILAHGMNGYA
jgi:hypothetical protein